MVIRHLDSVFVFKTLKALKATAYEAHTGWYVKWPFCESEETKKVFKVIKLI